MSVEEKGAFTMLLMTDVSKTYPSGSVALRDVNIHIQPGEFVFVVGPSGAGKSTFIKMLFREVIPTTGNIYVNGVDLLELKEKEIPYLRRQLGIIFQDYRLLPDRTVYDNVAFAMQVIETPYRNNKMIEDILHNCRPQTKLCIAADITCEGEYIKTKTVKEWKGKVPDLSKIPCIFLLYK